MLISLAYSFIRDSLMWVIKSIDAAYFKFHNELTHRRRRKKNSVCVFVALRKRYPHQKPCNNNWCDNGCDIGANFYPHLQTVFIQEVLQIDADDEWCRHTTTFVTFSCSFVDCVQLHCTCTGKYKQLIGRESQFYLRIHSFRAMRDHSPIYGCQSLFCATLMSKFIDYINTGEKRRQTGKRLNAIHSSKLIW